MTLDWILKTSSNYEDDKYEKYIHEKKMKNKTTS